MDAEVEQAYRNLALEIVDTFGEPLFQMFTKALGGDGRLLNTAADGIWIGSRKQIQKFPPQLIAHLKQFKGTERIQKFLLAIAPSFIMTAPIDIIEKTLNEMHPILDRLNALREMEDSPNGKAKS